MRNHFTPVRMANVGEDVEKGEPCCTVGGNVNWYSHSGKLWRLLRELNIQLPYDPAIKMLGFTPKIQMQ